MPSYIAELKRISANIILLYRNFFHWNVSKICIFLYENIVAFLLSLPFVGGIVYQYFTSYSQLGMVTDIEGFLLGNIGSIATTAILLLCIVTIFICMYTYGNFLMQNVYKSYLAGEKLPYTANLYFSWKHFRAYMGILGWASLYLLAPIGTGLILIIPFGILAKTALGLSSLVVGIISLILFIILFVWFVHLMIRLLFSYYILLYSEEVTKGKDYIDESFRLTKKKAWKIVLLAFPFFFVLGLLAGITETAQDTMSEGRVYESLRTIQQQSGQDDHKLLEWFYNGSEEDKEIFVEIEKNFEPKTNDIDRGFLRASMEYIDTEAIDPTSGRFTLLFVVLSFVFLEGIASMLYLSIYRSIKEKEEEGAKRAPIAE